MQGINQDVLRKMRIADFVVKTLFLNETRAKRATRNLSSSSGAKIQTFDDKVTFLMLL